MNIKLNIIEVLKKNLKIIIAIIITLIVVLYVIKSNDWLNKYLPCKLHIDETALILKEINKEQKLYTAMSYHELVVDTTYNSKAITINQPKLVIIIKGFVKMGFDLSDFKKENITQKADSIIIKLPNKQIEEVVINPTDIEIFEQKGYWGDATISYLVEKAKKEMINSAKFNGLDQKCKKSLEEILSSLTKNKKTIAVVNKN